jgi:hypothetical protein
LLVQFVAALWMATKKYNMLNGRKSAIFRIWEAPLVPEALQSRWGARRPTQRNCFRGPRACPDPQNDRISIQSAAAQTNKWVVPKEGTRPVRSGFGPILIRLPRATQNPPPQGLCRRRGPWHTVCFFVPVRFRTPSTSCVHEKNLKRYGDCNACSTGARPAVILYCPRLSIRKDCTMHATLACLPFY